jgi:chemotaxis protein histidine kinase CheA
MKYAIALFFYCLYLVNTTLSQNLNGSRINVAEIAPAYIQFKDKIKAAEFNTKTAYDNYTIRVRNEDNTLTIQYAGNDPAKVIDEGISINEGGRNHFLIVSFLKDYDVNKHKQLFYPFNDIKELKKIAQSQSQNQQKQTDDASIAQKEKEAQDKAERERQISIEQSKKEAERNAVNTLKEKEAQQKQALKEEQEKQKALAAAKKEAEKLNKDQKLAEQKEKEAIAARAKETERVKKLEAQNKLDEIAKEKAKEKETQQLLAIEKAKKVKEEKEAALLQAAQKAKDLEEKNKKETADKAYTSIGLWKRYGSKGINVYDIPEEQLALANGDFFLAKDTTYNYEQATAMLQKPVKESLKFTTGNFKSGVTLSLESIEMHGPFSYYRFKIDNPTSEDFLTGAVVLDLYDQDKKPKQRLRCSYFTYIYQYPIIKPNTAQSVVFVTRSIVIDDNDDIIIQLKERRKEKGDGYILIKGKEYNNIYNSTYTELKAPNKTKEEKAEKKSKKEKKKKKTDSQSSPTE